MALTPRTLLSQRNVLGAKPEVTPGTAMTLTSGDQNWPMFNPRWRELTAMEMRPQPNIDGFLPSVHGILFAELAFQIELCTGTAQPAMAACFLGMLGLIWSAVAGGYVQTRQLPTDPANPTQTNTLQFFEDGTLRTLYGAAGNGVFHFLPDDRILIDITARGKMVAEADATQPTPTFGTQDLVYWASSPPQAGGSVVPALSFTPGGGSAFLPVVSMFDLDLGNVIVPRHDANAADGSGVDYFHIGPRATRGTFVAERNQVAYNDFIGQWLSSVQMAFAIHGNDRSSATTPHTVDLSASLVQWMEPEDQSQDGKAMRKLGVQFASPDLTLKFA